MKSKAGRISQKLFGQTKEVDASSIEEIAQACNRMSETKTGALMVFKRRSALEFVVATGDMVDSLINRRLIG